MILRNNEDKRMEAMNVIDGMARVASCPEAFGYVLEAAQSEKMDLLERKNLLEEACKAAHVQDDMAKYIMEIVFENSVIAQHSRHDQNFCW